MIKVVHSFFYRLAIANAVIYLLATIYFWLKFIAVWIAYEGHRRGSEYYEQMVPLFVATLLFAFFFVAQAYLIWVFPKVKRQWIAFICVVVFTAVTAWLYGKDIETLMTNIIG